MLGCWGIGDFLAGSNARGRKLEYGPFAGCIIPSASAEGMASLSKTKQKI